MATWPIFGPSPRLTEFSRSAILGSMNCTRIDKHELLSAHLHEDGYMFAQAVASRVGVFTYLNPDGSTRRELRPPDEVLHEDSVASLAGIPLTDDHPTDAEDGVNAGNAHRFSVGILDKDPERIVSKAGGHVRIGLTIQDASAVRAVQAGKTQLSPGYTVDLDETPGVWEGERYDAVQRNIRYNHLAIVGRGRQGSTVSLRADQAIALDMEPQEKPMPSIRLDGVDWPVEDGDLAKAMAKVIIKAGRVDELETEVSDNKASLATAETERDAERKRADDLQVKLDERNEPDVAGILADLEKVRPVARALKLDAEGTDPGVLKRAVVNHYLGNEDARTDEAIDAAFAVVEKSCRADIDEARKLGDAAEGAREDGGRTRNDEANATWFENQTINGRL